MEVQEEKHMGVGRNCLIYFTFFYIQRYTLIFFGAQPNIAQ